MASAIHFLVWQFGSLGEVLGLLHDIGKFRKIMALLSLLESNLNTLKAAMSTLRPMTIAEYAEWLEKSIPSYAAEKVVPGQWTKEESLALSKKESDELLPQGLETPDHYLFTIVDSTSAPVGMLWFAVKTKFNARIAYVFDISIRPDRQREGYAMRAFQDLEAEVRKHDLAGIALHVFGHNAGARALYAKLGYEPTNLNLFKSLKEA